MRPTFVSFKCLFLLLLFGIGLPLITFAQTTLPTSVTGSVKGEEGEPLSNATIFNERTKETVLTGENGEFTIALKENDRITITYVGKQPKTLTYRVDTDFNVVLNNDEKSRLGDVTVVATGYTNVDRKLFTGSSTQILAKDAMRSGVPDVSRMLEGQAAGVSVQNVSGTFGAAPKIRIRGATSLSGDNKPLWVIDGIILEDIVNISNEALTTGDANTLIGSSIAGLNPDDIESMTILRDAAATALYGARAMNGVIVVNTKKGRNTQGRASINYSGNFTTYLKPNYSQFDIMNSAEQMSVMLELENKGYFNHSQISRGSSGGIFFKMYNKMYDYDPATDSYALKNTLSDRLAFLQRYAKANTDWFDVLFKNSLLQEHSVSITTGSDKAQTYFSTSFLNDNGQSLGDNVKRYTANFRNNIKINNKLSVEFGVNGSVRDQRAPGTLTRNSDPVYGQYSRDFDINPYSYALNTSRLLTPYDEDGNLEFFTRNYAPFNILNELQRNYLELKSYEMQVRAGLKYNIVRGLNYSFDAAYRFANTKRQHYIKEGSNMAEAFRANGDATIAAGNIQLYKDPDLPNSLPVVVLPEGGFYNTNDNALKNYYMRNTLEYDKRWGEAHWINLLGMTEIRYTDRQFSNFQGIGYQYENGGLVNPNYRYFKKMIEGGQSYFGMDYGYERFVANMFRAAYSLYEKYTINGTYRYDGANLMGRSPVARWVPTWNVSAAWDIDRENFFNPENKIFSSARVRATYGLVGNLGNATNSSAVFYNQITYRPYENEKEAAIGISSLENSQLTWEKLYELNLGADISFLKKRIDLTVDWYKRNIFDLIGPIKTSGIGGQFTKTANYGNMTAQGFEFTLGGNVIRNPEGVNWRTQFNFGYNKNKITNLDVTPTIWTLVRAEGGAMKNYAQRGLFSLKFDGLDPNYGYPTFINEKGERDTYIYLQSDDVEHLHYHGPVDPVLTGGFFNRITYKGFSLSALFTFASGNHIRLQPTFSAYYTDMVSMSKDMVNRWIMPGDEAHTTIPALLDLHTANNVRRANGSTVSAAYPYNAYNYSTERVAKGDFVRFKNISLAYVLPNSLINRWGLSSAQIALVGNNIALLYADKKLNGADPEFFNNGGVAMPIPRQYTLSVKFGL